MMNQKNRANAHGSGLAWLRRVTAFVCTFAMLFSSCGPVLSGDTALAQYSEDYRVTSDPIYPTTPLPSLLPSATPEADPEATPIPEEYWDWQGGALTASGDGWTATLTYRTEAKIPDGAVLTLTELKGADLYNAMKSAAALLKNDADEVWRRELSNEDNHFFTASITDPDGNTVQPQAAVALTWRNTNHDSEQTYFSFGDEASRIVESADGTMHFKPYLGESFGYGATSNTQIGTVTQVHDGSDYMVTASYGPEAGFPAGTELKVREIMPGTAEYATYSGMTDEALGEDWSEITLERYFDIAFVKDGKELEPQADIDVQISFSEKIELTEEHDVAAVHIENNEATVIETETESNEAAKYDSEAIDTVAFSSDSFSVYGVVQKKRIITKVLEAGGNTYEIELSYTQEAEIPENAQLIVEEIPEGSDLWEAYRIQTAAALKADDVRLPGLYDISIVDEEGKKVEPKVPVNVAIMLLNDNTTEDIQIVHFKEEMPQELVDEAAQQAEQAAQEAPVQLEEQQLEEQKEELKAGQSEAQPEEKSEEPTEVQAQPAEPSLTIESETITATVEGDTVTFEAESFSVFAFAYTLDFTYMDESGAEHKWSFPGCGQYAVSEILAVIGVNNRIVSASLDLIQGESVDGELYLTKDEAGEWLLNSDIPFHNTYRLTIVTENGEYVLEITDAEIGTITANDTAGGHLEYAGNRYTVLKKGNPLQSDSNNKFKQGIVAKAHEGYAFSHWTCGNWGSSWDSTNYHDATIPGGTMPDNSLDGQYFIANFYKVNKFTVKVNEYSRSMGSYSSRYLDANQKNTTQASDSSYEYTGYGAVKSSKDHSTILAHPFNPIAFDGYQFAMWVYEESGKYKYISKLDAGTAIPYDGVVYQANFAPQGQFMILGFSEDNNKGTVQGLYAYSDSHEQITAVPNSGYTFDGWYDQDGNRVCPYTTFEPEMAGKSMVVYARFKPLVNNGVKYYTSVNNPAYGQLKMSRSGDNPPADYPSATYTYDDCTIKYRIHAVANEGFVFSHWTLNGKALSNTSPVLQKDTLPTVYLNSGDQIQAVFVPATIIDDSGVTPGITIDAAKKAALHEWMETLSNDLTIQATDKTAHVLDQNNRIYEVDLSGKSAAMSLTANIDLAFLLDMSGSMRFPSKLVSTGKNLVLSQSNLNEEFPNDNKKYYIISDPEGTSTVYRIYRNGDGIWGFTDASYNDFYRISDDGSDRFVEKSGEPPYVYQIYADGEEGKLRQHHLNQSLTNALASAREVLSIARQSDDTSDIRVAYNHFASSVVYSHPEFSSILTGINVNITSTAGGTRQDLALQDAQSFNWDTDTSKQKYAILITDGAPVVGSGSSMTVQQVYENIAAQAQLLKNKGVKLITVGLSTRNVKGGSAILSRIADTIGGVKQFYQADSGDDLEAILLEILQSIMMEANIKGSVTDTVDEAFYPLNSDNSPVSVGNYTMGGEPIADVSGYTDPYYTWSFAENKWTITWHNQLFGWDTDNADWKASFRIKAKENFLGGNRISTNDGDAEFQAEQLITPDGTEKEITQEAISLPSPLVNVRTLELTNDESEQNYQVGDIIDAPKNYLNTHFANIDVRKVVSADENEMITSAGDMLGGTSDSSLTFKLDTVLDDLGEELTKDQWDTLKEGNPLTITYSAYGHDSVGNVILQLVPWADNDVTPNVEEHTATVEGSPAEIYTLTVSYTVDDTDAAETYDRTTPGESAGTLAQPIESENVHTINVLDAETTSISVVKVWKNANDGPLSDGEKQSIEVELWQHEKNAGTGGSAQSSTSGGGSIGGQSSEPPTGVTVYITKRYDWGYTNLSSATFTSASDSSVTVGDTVEVTFTAPWWGEQKLSDSWGSSYISGPKVDEDGTTRKARFEISATTMYLQINAPDDGVSNVSIIKVSGSGSSNSSATGSGSGSGSGSASSGSSSDCLVKNLAQTETRADATVELNSGNGWTYTWDNLNSASYTYYVKETTELSNFAAPVYTYGMPAVEVPAGGITEGTITVTNTSTKPTVGNLKITKAISGNASSDLDEFTFTVALTGNTENLTYSTVKATNDGQSTDGSITFNSATPVEFTLKGSESLLIKNLPANCSYSVEETNSLSYTLTAVPGNASGTVPAGGLVVVPYENVRNVGDGGFKLKKVVVATENVEEEQQKEFIFTIRIMNDDTTTNTSFNGTYGDITFTDGVANNIKLKHNGEITVSGLPYNTFYEISETYEDPFDQTTLYVETVQVSNVGNNEERMMPLRERITTDAIVDVVVTNTKSDTISVTAHKAFTEGSVKPTAVQLTLRRKGGDEDDIHDIDVVTVTEADNWTHEWTNLDKVYENWTGNLNFTYFVVETGLYFGELDGNPIPADKWVPANIARSSEGILEQTAGNNYTITITNTSYTNVPVVKGWPDFSNEKYNWYAKFRLLKKEVLLFGNAAGDAALEWTPVTGTDGNQLTVTATKANSAPSFTHMDVYSKHSNGSVYRVLYKVEEYEYKVWENGNEGSPIAQWSADPDSPLTTITYQDHVYVPVFDNEVAGENVAFYTNLSERYTIVLNNMPQEDYSGKLVVRKEWLGIAKEDLHDFPEVYFTLYYLDPYQYEYNTDAAHVYVGDNGVSYVNKPLNYQNNWTCAIPDLNPDYRYFVVETAIPEKVERTYDNGIVVGRYIKVDEGHSISNNESWSYLYYYTIEGYASREIYNEGSWNESSSNNIVFKYDEPNRHAVGSQGEIVIRNKCPAEYMQMDLKKKFLEYVTDDNQVTSLYTTTSEDDTMRNMYIKLQMYRRTVVDNPATIGKTIPASDVVEPWDTYEYPFLVGYTKDNQEDIRPDPRNTFEVEDAEGTWAYRIPERKGLPRRGFYKDSNDNYIRVRYQYLFKEVDVLDGDFNSIGGEWAAWLPYLWEAKDMNSQAKTPVFALQTAQDEDRILNVPGASLVIQKDWAGGHSEIEEIYVKIYRKTAGSQENWVDYTVQLAQEMSLGAIAQDYLGSDSRYLDTTHNYLVLNDTNHWKLTIHHVPVQNMWNDGKVFDYKIVEVGYKDIHNPTKIYTLEETEEAFNPQYYVWDNNKNSYAERTDGQVYYLRRNNDNKLMVQNTIPYGSLQIIKDMPTASINSAKNIEFKFNVSMTLPSGKTLADGDLKIAGGTISNANYSSNPVTFTVTITGANTATITKIPFGTTYEVEETNVPDGWVCTGTVYSDDTETPRTVEASDSTPDTVTITNNEYTSIRVDKTWLQANGSTSINSSLTNASVTVELRDAAGHPVTNVNGNQLTSAEKTIILNGSETPAWEYTWTNLSKVYPSGDPIEYKVVETSATVNSTLILASGEVKQATKDASTENLYHLTNTLPTKSIEVTKAWVDGTSNEWPSNIDHVTIGLYTTNGSSTVPYLNDASQMTINISSGNNQKGTFENLPVYDDTGAAISYSIKELSVTTTGEGATTENVADGYVTIAGVDSWQVSIADVNASDKATVTNTRVKTDIQIKKIDGKTEQPLTGASFRLERNTGNKDSAGKDLYDTVAEFTITESNGIHEITGLSDGEYQLTETSAPAGYIGLSGPITFSITKGVVGGYDSTINYVPDTKTFTIANTPGAELPATGGSGTLAYTLGGLALILLAGALWTVRKRRKA